MKSIISGVRLWTLRIPLPIPLFLGEIRIAEREFALAIIETSDGLKGWGATFSRGAPIAAVAKHCFASLLCGKNALDVSARWKEMFEAAFMYGQEGMAARAISILDIALWDLRAKSAGQPLYRLLGGTTERLPLLIPAGYRREGETKEDLLREIEYCREAGATAIKLMLSVRQLEEKAELLVRIREKIGDHVQLGNDFFYKGGQVSEVLSVLDAVKEARLDFIEDPFPTIQVEDFERLATRWRGMIMTGELCGGFSHAQSIAGLPGLGAVRWDATVCGGVTPWLHMQSLATTRGLFIHPHCAPEIHAHLLASRGTGWLETSLPAYESINLAAILSDPLPIKDGSYHLPQKPGLGLEPDAEKLKAYAVPT